MSPDAMALEERQPQFIRLIICLLLSLIKITWGFFFPFRFSSVSLSIKLSGACVENSG